MAGVVSTASLIGSRRTAQNMNYRWLAGTIHAQRYSPWIRITDADRMARRSIIPGGSFQRFRAAARSNAIIVFPSIIMTKLSRISRTLISPFPAG